MVMLLLRFSRRPRSQGKVGKQIRSHRLLRHVIRKDLAELLVQMDLAERPNLPLSCIAFQS